MILTPEMHIDIETYSSVNIKECGVYKYVESQDFQVLLFAYSVDDSDPEVIDLTRKTLPQEIVNLLYDPNVKKYAQNAVFERLALSKYCGKPIPVEQWKCSMIEACKYGLPASLEQLSSVLLLDADKKKMNVGKSLIRLFCVPQKPTKANGHKTRIYPNDEPEKWELFKEYNRMDVVAEMEITKILKRYRASLQIVTQVYWDRDDINWYVDQAINDRGLRVDTELINNVLEYGQVHTKKLNYEVESICPGMNINSVMQLKDFIETHDNIKLKALRKEDLDSLLKNNKLTRDSRRLLEIRKELSKTSVKKYEAFARSTCNDGRIHGAFQYYGANRTGRWAGRLIQPQNFPRNAFDDINEARQLIKDGQYEVAEMLYGSLNEVFSTLIRTAVIPSEGMKFVIADYSAIEARVIAWLSNEKWRQDVFANGGDIYCASASQMFKVPVVKHGENGHLRQKGKIAELALGYGGGIGAMKAMGGDKMGLTDSEMEEIVQKWRASSPNIVKLWKGCQTAAESAIVNQKPGIILHGIYYLFKPRGANLYARLPSGRMLTYSNARKVDGKILYDGVNQTRKTWTTLDTWGGKLVENLVQAIARDCLAIAMQRLTKEGYRIVMHIHDEVVIEVPKEHAESDLKRICEIMGQPIEWAKGLILTAEGFISDYYRKD